MNILHVYPTYPDTFWSFRHALKFISKKAAYPPLGSLTVAAMLPENWNQRFVDMNVEQLKDRDLLWADYVFISAMSIQRASAEQVIARCKSLRRKIVAGGPLFTAHPNDFDHVDHLVLNEAEITLPPFIDDLRKGHAQHLYTSKEWADIATTPNPLWKLANLKHYSSVDIQYSRGCPYDCEFCDITVLYGREPRTKTKDQLIGELNCLYDQGWRGNVFLVDDNFIGNRKKLKQEILPAMIAWMEEKNHPFSFTTEASINLSDDESLMSMMVKAGFEEVFVGIESPNEESLIECKKIPNKNRDLLASVKRIQKAGLCVNAGFIVGFDSDPVEIFERLSDFIKESGIVTAMVGLLNAPRGTKLYARLQKEGRILKSFSGDNTNFSLNFIPRMHPETLLNGYKSVLKSIYSPKQYYARVRHFLKDFKPTNTKTFHFEMNRINALIKSMVRLGILGKERYHYWKLFVWMLFRRPRLFPLAITFAIYGYHFRKLFEEGLVDV